MSLVLEGTLSDIGLCDLLRLVAREKRSGALRVTIDGRTLRFALHDGHLTGVRCDGEGEEASLEPAILELVRHRRGAFRLEPPHPDDPQGEGNPPASGIHAEVLAGAGDMELVHLCGSLDELGGEDSRPARDAFPTPRQLEALDSDGRAVYALVDGARTLGEIVVRSQLDPKRVIAKLGALVEESLVKLPRPEPRAVETAAPLAGRAAGAWREGAALAVPLLLLLGFLGLAGSGPAAPAHDPFAIHHDPLGAARAAHELERLRAALEAHRFAEGGWPADLGTLADRGYVPRAALTDAHGRPYYYAARGDDFVLLAPER